MKRNYHIINMWLGILIALAAAFLFPIIIYWHEFALNERLDGAGFFLLVPFYGLLYTFWFVIPLGAALGVIIPEAVREQSRWKAALVGAGLGIFVGSIVCLAMTLIVIGTEVSFLSLIVYCVVWTGAYAAIRAGSMYRYR